MITHTKRSSLAWTLFLIFLFTTQIQDTEAGMSLKLKKLLKKVLLLRALAGKKGITILPIPIPLNLFMKDKVDDMKMEKMPESMFMQMPMPEPLPMPEPMPMKMPSYPMYMQDGNKMMGYDMMMPKESNIPPPRTMMGYDMMMPKESNMPPHRAMMGYHMMMQKESNMPPHRAMMGNMQYGMMGGD